MTELSGRPGAPTWPPCTSHRPPAPLRGSCLSASSSRMIPDLKRYADVYAIMFRNSLVREMSFKANFLGWMGVELLWFIGQLVFIEVIFSYVDKIGDWTKWE